MFKKDAFLISIIEIMSMLLAFSFDLMQVEVVVFDFVAYYPKSSLD